MRGEPYTGCKLRVAFGDTPPEEAFLLTARGSAYRVDRVAGKTLHCTRWPKDEIPDDAEVWTWAWASRS